MDDRAKLRQLEGLDDEQPVSVPIRSVQVIERDEKGGSYGTDLDSWLFKRRVVRLYVDVREDTMADLQAKLQFLEQQAIDKWEEGGYQAEDHPENQPIHFYINSPGGSVIQALSAYDTISSLACPVYTYVNGYAASAGSLLAMAGAPGHRYILPNAKMMLHELSGGTQGKLTMMNNDNKLSNHLEDNLESIYAHHTGRTIRELRSWLRNGDRWLTAEDAVAHNLSDEVIKVTRMNEPLRGFSKPNRLEPQVKRSATRRVKAPVNTAKGPSTRAKSKAAPAAPVAPPKDIQGEGLAS